MKINFHFYLTDRFNVSIKNAKEYQGIYRMWLGPSLSEIRIQRCDYAEEILKSSKHIEKSDSYKLMMPWLGQGKICLQIM